MANAELDSSTDDDALKAYVYSTPTVADLDSDGKVEIIVGTSKGHIYVLSSTGEVREGFPVAMAEIQGQIAVTDVNGDGRLGMSCDCVLSVGTFMSVKRLALWWLVWIFSS